MNNIENGHKQQQNEKKDLLKRIVDKKTREQVPKKEEGKIGKRIEKTRTKTTIERHKRQN